MRYQHTLSLRVETGHRNVPACSARYRMVREPPAVAPPLIHRAIPAPQAYQSRRRRRAQNRRRHKAQAPALPAQRDHPSMRSCTTLGLASDTRCGSLHRLWAPKLRVQIRGETLMRAGNLWVAASAEGDETLEPHRHLAGTQRNLESCTSQLPPIAQSVRRVSRSSWFHSLLHRIRTLSGPRQEFVPSGPVHPQSSLLHHGIASS